MTDLNTTDAVTAAQQHAATAWRLFTSERNLNAIVPDWREGAGEDGTPNVSAEVVGPGAAHALQLFTANYYVVLGGPGDQRPAFSYGTPGRVSCVWRKDGVWIELWHPEVQNAPLPAPQLAPVPASTARRILSRPSGRLPFGRRTKTTKETPAA
ncbi:hypothetical protein [Streptomyces sp. NPDC047868]|uniref:hypothetical protein n=1 Tax=Streptomyces sp. NPDC047868 TaxID=3155480 RepID=UPI00345363C7